MSGFTELSAISEENSSVMSSRQSLNVEDLSELREATTSSLGGARIGEDDMPSIRKSFPTFPNNVSI